MNPLAVVLAVVAGLGLLCVVLALAPRRFSPAAVLGTGRAAARSSRRVLGRIEHELRGKESLQQDARMVGRSLESHALAKMAGLVLGGALFGGGGAFLGALGVDLPPLVIVVVAGLGAFLGWWLPDSMLRSEADKQRRYFQQSAESWLELAGQLVTAGSDTFAALVTAASYSDQPTFVVLQETLREAAARGDPPWTGLRRLAHERRLRFLDPFCAALELAGTTGAGSRETILAQVDSARAKAVHEADAAAASAGEKMGAPLALIGGAFMVLMGYPPLAGIMDTATLTGPGL